MLQRALIIGLAAVALAASPAEAQQRRQQQQAPATPPPPQRIPWTVGVPARPPEGTIGIAAIAPRYCSLGIYGSAGGRPDGIQVLVMNRTEHTIRFAAVEAELITTDERPIASFNIQYADPNRETRFRISAPGLGCSEPIILRIRDVRLCERRVRWPSGCGARFERYAPERYSWIGSILDPQAFEVRIQLD